MRAETPNLRRNVDHKSLRSVALEVSMVAESYKKGGAEIGSGSAVERVLTLGGARAEVRTSESLRLCASAVILGLSDPDRQTANTR